MSVTAGFIGRLGLQQRVLPTYRVEFFDYLAKVCTNQLSVYAGSPRTDEGIHPADKLKVAQYHHGRNIHLFRSPFYLCWQLDLISWLQHWNPDALIMEANPRYLSSRNAIAWMHKRGRPILGWGLGAPEGLGSLAKLRSIVRRQFVNKFNVMIAYSERGANEYAELGFPRERIVVAANAVALPPEARPERAPLAGRPARVIFVGRLQARKRVDLLLKACAQLDPMPEVVIVGEGPERAALETLAERTFPTAIFLGALFDQQLQHALENADLFVMPGTGGLAVQQAMASGLPVIVAEGDGTQNDLVSGDNGWLIPPEDLDALIAVLRSAHQVPERLEKMGAASFELAVKRFNIHSMRDQFLHALDLAQEVF
jgi:glycosyltransferase involved in cell wall biosynthesis